MEALLHFIALVKNQFNKTIKIIRSDNGPEFNMKIFYDAEGIIHQTSCIETLRKTDWWRESINIL